MNVSTAEIHGSTVAVRRVRWLPALALVVLVFVAWSNTFRAPFELDDDSSIRENSTIRHLGSFQWLRPPSARGETVSGRPVVNLSFALDYAVGGLDVRGYHAVNVAIHALAAMVLFGLVRRTFLLPRLQPRFGASASGLAFVAAALWALHPLQTESVTYIVQRAQSLMGLWYLLTLYCFVRAAPWAGRPYPAGNGERNQQRGGGATVWYALSVAASAIGMATKEDMVFAPVVVLLFDRALVAGSFGEAWRRRRGYYAVLAATWVVLGVLLVTNFNRGGSAGFGTTITPLDYALTQAAAWCRYLRLALWPSGLVFDYGTATVASLGAVVPQVAIVIALIAAIGAALARNLPLGFLGGWFCLSLIPSSSLVPVATQTMAEHRMYVALAPVVIAAVAFGHRIGSRRLRIGLASILILGAGMLTLVRNHTYGSAVTLWHDTVAKAPDNPRAHNNLGMALLHAGQIEEAKRGFQRAIALQPNHAFARANLGMALLMQRQWEAAVEQFNVALAADPHLVNARVNLGFALTQLGRKTEAVAQYRAALADDPGAHDARTNLAGLLIDAGQAGEARSLLRDVLTAEPGRPEAHYQLGRALEQMGDQREAEAEYRAAAGLKSGFADAHLALGNLLVHRGALAEAGAEYREAIRLDAGRAAAHYALGNVFARQQHFDSALAEYNEALRLEPDHLEARGNRANCELVTGRLQEAIADFEFVLRARPGDATISQNLQIARQLASQQPR